MSVRVDRVREQIRQEVAGLLQRGEVHDPRLAMSMISITDVTLSRDLQYAVIYFTAMGQETESVLAGLNRASGFMRAKVGRSLGLRHAPALKFQPDLTLNHVDHLEKLLKSIHIPPVATEENKPPSSGDPLSS